MGAPPTNTFTRTYTPTVTLSDSPTPTVSPTPSDTATVTPTFSNTPNYTHTSTPTFSVTNTFTTIPSPTNIPTLGPGQVDHHVITDGAIQAITVTSSAIYIGGSFNYVGYATGGAGVWDLAAKQLSLVFPAVTGQVSVVIPDGSGGFYIGGNFTDVGGQARTGLARLLYNGVVDVNFAPVVNGSVHALALGNGRLYVGGQYSINGQPNTFGLASVDPASGAADAGFNANTDIIGVNCITVSGGAVYLGGNFSTVGGLTRYCVAKVDAATGAVDPGFNAGIPNSYPDEVDGLAASGSKVYIGGHFTNAGGTSVQYLAQVDALSGSVNTSFSPNPNGDVLALLISGNGLYVAGAFSTIAGNTNNSLALLDATTGTNNPTFAPYCYYSAHGLALYNGDLFVATGSYISYSYGADPMVFNATTGATDPAYPIATDAPAACVAVSGSHLMLGGTFSSIGIPVGNAAKLDPVTYRFDPGFNAQADYGVYSLAVSSAGLYVGGIFQNLGGSSRFSLGRVNPSTGAADPAFSPSVVGAVNALALSPGNVYFAGNGEQYQAPAYTYRFNLTRMDTSGVMQTAFNAGPDTSVNAVFLAGSRLYAGGTFHYMNTLTRTSAALVDATSGGGDLNFNPLPDGPVNALAVNATDAYLGGAYWNVSGQPRVCLASVDPSTGALKPGFDAGLVGYYSTNTPTVYALMDSSYGVFAGGSFVTCQGSTYNGLALLNHASGAPSAAFDPSPGGVVYALAMASSGNIVYAGGSFPSTWIGQTTNNFIAAPFSTSMGTLWPLYSPTPSFTVTPSLTISPTFTISNTFSPSPTFSQTCTITPSSTITPTATATPTASPTLTATPTFSASPTPSDTATVTATVTPGGYSGTSAPTTGQAFVYPSPAKGDTVHVAYHMAGQGSVKILVWNEAGELVDQVDDTKPMGDQVSPLRIATYAQGLYFFQVILTYDAGGVDKTGIQKFTVVK